MKTAHPGSGYRHHVYDHADKEQLVGSHTTESHHGEKGRDVPWRNHSTGECKQAVQYAWEVVDHVGM